MALSASGVGASAHRVTLAVADGLEGSLPPSDAVLRDALRERGLDVRVGVWSRTDDWRDDPGIVLVRACWDYHQRLPHFLAWLDALRARGIPVRNPVDVIRWNARKRYLHDLAARGVPTIRTAILRTGAPVDPAAALRILAESDRMRWTHVVIKPEVSASGEGAWRATLPLAAPAVEQLRAGLARGDHLVQPFRREVIEVGEVSLVLFGGVHSHAVLKRARDGEFRVQKDHGGSVSVIEAAPELVTFGHQAVAAAAAASGRTAADLLYARVDLLPIPGAPELMEIELIEPELFLDRVPGAAARFADAVVALSVGDRAA